MPPNLPLISEDSQDEVLARLPAKEIARLRCVCRRWLSLTTDHRFIQHHSSLNPHPPTSGFFLCDHICGFKHFPLNSNAPGLPDPSLSFIPVFSTMSRFFILSSCNGLAIFSQVSRWPRYRSKHYVCNPTTRQFVEFAQPEGVCSYFSLAFDPSKSAHYKVVCIGHNLHVYSSATRSWRLTMSKDSLRGFGKFDGRRGVYWDGALVWTGNGCLVSYDADREMMKKLPHQCETVIYLGESGGRLQMIGKPSNVNVATEFDILEMDSGSSCWSVLCRVDLRPMLDLYPPRDPPWLSGVSVGAGNRHPLTIWPVHFIRKEAESMLVLSIPRRIVAYKIRDEEFRGVCDVKFPRAGYYYAAYDWRRFYPIGHTFFSP